MATIICITNQKGGVGKTTTTGCIATIFKSRGYRVLCVDLDPQANLSFSVDAGQEGSASVYEALRGDITAGNAIKETPCFDVIPSNILLSGVELEFTSTGREYLLKEALASVTDRYDYIFLDTPPALGILTVNAFTASSHVIIPMLADIFSLQGIAQLADTISRVKNYCNPSIVLEGILLTRYNPRTILGREVRGTAEMIANQIQTEVFRTSIRSSVAMMEAQANQVNILEYAPENNAVKDYVSFVDELIERGL